MKPGLDGWVSEIQQQVYQAPEDTAAQLVNGQLEVTMAQDGRQVSGGTVRDLLLSVTDAASADSYSFTLQPETLPAKTLTAQELHDQLHGEMKNASYDTATGTIVSEQPGADFDVDTVQSAMDKAAPGETLTLDAIIEEPKVTAKELKAVLFRDVLGEARTHVSGSAGRIGNVKLSAQTINGIVLNSGDIFSYNQSVGKRTEARGYKPAPAYVKGETVDEVGRRASARPPPRCISRACRSNLEIVQRYAHRYAPSYITWGLTPPSPGAGRDYQFANDTNYPIKIVTSYSGGYLTVTIYGTKVDDITVKMTTEKLSDTPYETIYEDDPTLAPGTEKVKTTPYTGHKVRSYRNLYDGNGNLISSTLEAVSDYKSRNKVILRGPALPAGRRRRDHGPRSRDPGPRQRHPGARDPGPRLPG